MKKLFAIALGFFMACIAHAQTAPITEYTYTWATGWHSTRSAGCSSAYSGWSALSPGAGGANFAYNATTHVCSWTSTSPSQSYSYTPVSRTVCPSGSTLTNGQCVLTSACADKAGIPQITNFTVGYARTTGQDDYDMVGGANQVPSDGTLCDGGCTVNRGSGSAAWRSLTPTSQGLYRLSIDFNTVPTGGTCAVGTTGSLGATNPTTPNPPCPGFVGEVQGKIGCFGTAAQPVTTAKGSTGGLPTGSGNPAAGTKPVTGEGSGSTGSGRTPAAGTGGNSGGPATAAQGPTGSVTAPIPGEEQAACGAPGQPRCAIDETGTPSDKGSSFTPGESQLDTAKSAAESAISGAQGIAAPTWSFTFALPTGCTPFAVTMPLVNFTMNPCLAQSMIHDLMSMIWAAVTAFTIISMVGKTIRES